MTASNTEPALAAPRLFERVRVLTIQPPGYAHSAAFAELAEGIGAAFAALGAEVDSAINQPLVGEGVNIVFGAHLIAAGVALPGNAIIFNLEQLHSGMLVQPHYIELLRRHVVFDYSARNAALLREQTGNAHVHVLRIGYAEPLTRIGKAPVQDVDVLFQKERHDPDEHAGIFGLPDRFSGYECGNPPFREPGPRDRAGDDCGYCLRHEDDRPHVG